MAENEWIIDGHHYTCPACKKTMAIVINESDEGFDFCPFCGKRMSSQMADSKLEEIIDLLAKYGGFNREYLRDKLLTFANDGCSETKNKMELIASMFGKKLGEEFKTIHMSVTNTVKFTVDGLEIYDRLLKKWIISSKLLESLLTGRAVIIND